MSLSPAQFRAGVAGVSAVTLGALVGGTAGPEAGAVVGLLVNAGYAVTGDVAATFLRHRGDTRYLGWRELRGWHVPVVAAGLGVTFGTHLADPLVDAAKALAGDPHSAAQDLFWRLVIGIEPMALVVAADAQARGKRLGTFLLETWTNVTGSAVAALGLPLWDGAVHALFGELHGLARSFAAQAHYITGYSLVLLARGWFDAPSQVVAEVARGEAEQGRSL